LSDDSTANGMARDLDAVDYILSDAQDDDLTPEEATREFNEHVALCGDCDAVQNRLCFTGRLLNDIVSNVAAEDLMRRKT
jgi:hypothetical protein